MDLHSGHPFWLIKNGLPHRYPKLNKNISAQVIVMGGGITGAIQAYYLAEAGIDFVIVEKRSIGLGSTCASTALLQYQIDEPLTSLIEKRGKKDAINAYKLCAESIEKIEKMARKIGYRDFLKKPTLFFASYKKDIPFLENEFQLHKEVGFDVELLDSKKIKSQFGFDAPMAMYSRHSAQIDAYAFCHQTLQMLVKNGHPVYDRTLVESISHSKNGVTLKTSEGYTIKGEWLIYATGYEVVDFIEKDIVDLNSTWAIVSEQFEGVEEFWHENALIWETATPYLYLRTTTDNRIMLGGRDEQTNSAKRREESLKDKSKKLAKDFAKLFPDYAFKPEFSWSGTFGSTKDGLPYIGKYNSKPKGLFALGFGGNGITFSLIAAEILTDIILEKDNENVEMFGFDR